MHTTPRDPESAILESPSCAVKTVRIFTCNAATTGGAARHCLSRLHPDEQERYRQMTRTLRRQEWLAGRWLACEALRRVLGRVNPAALVTGTNGALTYTEARLHLSLSHSRGLVALALARTPVGVDIEQSRPRELVAHGERIFAPREAVAIANAKSNARLELFYRHWTLKEAFAKAAGEPLWSALHGAEFDLAAGLCTLPCMSRDWQLVSAKFAQGWLLAVALQGAGVDLEIHAEQRAGRAWQPQVLSDAIRLQPTPQPAQSITQSNGICGEISAS